MTGGGYLTTYYIYLVCCSAPVFVRFVHCNICIFLSGNAIPAFMHSKILEHVKCLVRKHAIFEHIGHSPSLNTHLLFAVVWLLCYCFSSYLNNFAAWPFLTVLKLNMRQKFMAAKTRLLRPPASSPHTHHTCPRSDAALTCVSSLTLQCDSVRAIHIVCVYSRRMPRCRTRAKFSAGVATFLCSDTVVFVFVFAIPVCLDPCDPVDCGNSVPPCHSEPVWRNDLVSRMRIKPGKKKKKAALLSLDSLHVSSFVSAAFTCWMILDKKNVKIQVVYHNKMCSSLMKASKWLMWWNLQVVQ